MKKMQFVAYIAVILFAISIDNVKSQSNYGNSTELIESLLSGYDKRLRPNYGVRATKIPYVETKIWKQDYTINFYFRQFWNDPRLTFERAGIETLGFGHDFSKSIWLPDTFFVNEKQGFAHSITTKNEFIKVRSSGDVIRSVRLSITASCSMDFRNFPMDTQQCPLSIESYGYTANDIKYAWKSENAVGVTTDLTLNLFELTGQRQKSEFIQLTTGNYSRLNAEFRLKRTTSHYFPQVYIPCTMIVVVAWISFWLNRRAAHVRLALCVLTMLLMPICLQILSTQFPKTSYTKAIDVYTGVSMTFVFFALAEFAYISNAASDKEDLSSLIDLIFRYGYAALFVLFNIIYWIVY